MDELCRLEMRLLKLFHGVDLMDGGISMSEAIVLDNYGGIEERRIARVKDELRDWTALVGTDALRKTIGGGALCYVDARGMRFYLAACLATLLRQSNPDNSPEIYRSILFHLGDSNSDSKLEILTQPQLQVVQDILKRLKERTDEWLQPDIDNAIRSIFVSLQGRT